MNKKEPTDGLMCGICGGRQYRSKGEPEYRMCDCDFMDLIRNAFGKKKGVNKHE